MSTYTQFYVLPVQKSKLDAYRQFAVDTGKIWLELGALGYAEFIADDVKSGVHTSFPQAVKLGSEETVVVAQVTFPSREECDRIAMAFRTDPRMTAMDFKSVPVDGTRMFWGGFKPFVGETAATPDGASAIQPYLFFRGRCEEAIEYYKKTLGAKVGIMMRFKDSPEKPDRDRVPAEMDNRIMHADMKIAGAEIMMSDGMKTGPLDFQCMSLSLAVHDEGEADRLYNALAKDGTVQVPMGPTFFAKKFGAVADKFGVSWMIMVPPSA